MGEQDTIVSHPGLIASLVAAGRDPTASAATLAEYRAVATPLVSALRCVSGRMT